MTETKKLSPSVARGLPLVRKLHEGAQMFREHRSGHDFAPIFGQVEEYDALLRRHSGVTLSEAKVFEIGFGARPYRQLVLQSMGVDVWGVDAEVPLLRGRPAEYVEMVRRNGMERATKSLVRHVFFDRGERRALHAAMRSRGLRPRLDPATLVVADVGDVAIAPDSLDLIFSEDVFEHIQRDTLESLVRKVAGWLRPGGLALIRPNVFTGIVGGHLLEWSRASMQGPPRTRRSEPWEHLRARRFEPNTYLNEMTRADYRALFSECFDVVEERVAQPDLGRDYYDERVQADLSQWPEDELFSNQTLYVLRPRADR